jgi:hypothetical protein
LDFEELMSTGTFQKSVLHHARVFDGSDDGELVTFSVGDGEADDDDVDDDDDDDVDDLDGL